MKSSSVSSLTSFILSNWTLCSSSSCYFSRLSSAFSAYEMLLVSVRKGSSVSLSFMTSSLLIRLISSSCIGVKSIRWNTSGSSWSYRGSRLKSAGRVIRSEGDSAGLPPKSPRGTNGSYSPLGWSGRSATRSGPADSPVAGDTTSSFT